MLIVQHTLVSPLNPPVVGIITTVCISHSSRARPIGALHSTSKTEEKKKEAIIKKPFHLIANLHTIFWPNFKPYISGNFGVLWGSAWKKFFRVCLGQPNWGKIWCECCVSVSSEFAAGCVSTLTVWTSTPWLFQHIFLVLLRSSVFFFF